MNPWTELTRGWSPVLLLLALCVFAYGHTLDVPMYLDDISSISDNSSIQAIDEPARIWQFSPLRFVGYFSFAANYAAHGSSVTGYHLVNIVIHLLAGLALYGLLVVLAKTPALSGSRAAEHMPLFALAAAAIFLVHPLNTQAVTYIVQRLASLVALFYLLSLWCFVLGRLAFGGARWPWFVLASICAVLALFTKQNAVTLPAAILLVELCFFPPDGLRRAVTWGVGLGFLGLLVLAILHGSGVLTLAELDELTRETAGIERQQYLAAQMLVLWRYIGLFLWPNPLILDYGLLPTWSFADWQVWLALLGHLLLIGCAGALLRRNPLAAFGILFYYLAHAVESGIIPIRDLMFEHRTYLPNAGLCIALAGTLPLLKPRVAVTGVAVATLVLGVLCWQRNDLWRDQIAFFNHAIGHAPDQPRNWVYLSKVYYKAGRYGDALDLLRREHAANQERNGTLQLSTEERIYWAKVLRAAGEVEEATEVEKHIASLKMSPAEQARVLLNWGNSALQAGDYQQAAETYREVLRLDPSHENAQVNLGVIAVLEGRFEEAIAIFERFPGNPVAAGNLPVARQALAGEVAVGGVNEKVIEKSR